MEERIDEFSIRMKKCRQELNLSFRELEELTGISRSTLQRYEKNSSSMRSDSVLKIAQALKVEPLYLMGLSAKDMPSHCLDSIEELIDESGYEIEYDSTSERYKLRNVIEKKTRLIESKDIIKVKSEITSFLKFKLNELLNNK